MKPLPKAVVWMFCVATLGCLSLLLSCSSFKLSDGHYGPFTINDSNALLVVYEMVSIGELKCCGSIHVRKNGIYQWRFRALNRGASIRKFRGQLSMQLLRDLEGFAKSSSVHTEAGTLTYVSNIDPSFFPRPIEIESLVETLYAKHILRLIPK